MFVFGHTGITLAAALALNGALPKIHGPETKPSMLGGKYESLEWPRSDTIPFVWLTYLADRIDIRLLLIGSLLPDIIDKPVGLFCYGPDVIGGRLFCHTLLFFVLITLAGLYLYWKQARNWLLTLAFGTFTHLVLDRMWQSPQTLLWPLYGFSFVTIEFSSYIKYLTYALLTNPALMIPEALGAAVIVWFGWLLMRRRKLYAFVRYGQL